MEGLSETSNEPKEAISPPIVKDSSEQAGEPNANNERPMDPSESAGLTKKQRKRLLKREQLLEKKRRRKEERHAQAKADGRDLAAEQRIQAENTASGHRQRRLEALWQTEKLPFADKSFGIAIDCSYESLMTEREVASLAQQLRYCYAANKKSPCHVAATSLKEGSATLTQLQKEVGFENWTKRCYTCTDKSLKEYYADQKKTLVYLTSDSETTLDKLENDKIYVIGGLVDRNRCQRAAIDRATEWGLTTAKLPLHLHPTMNTTPVLTTNHVFSILLACRDYQNDWTKALQEVLPERKSKQKKEKKKKKSVDNAPNEKAATTETKRPGNDEGQSSS